jgi:hypothetical protein
MLNVMSLSEICEMFREVLRLEGLSECGTLNIEVLTGTDRSFYVGHDFSRFFTLALQLSCQRNLRCPQPEIFNIERGYLSIELLDTDTKCRIKSIIKLRSALTFALYRTLRTS